MKFFKSSFFFVTIPINGKKKMTMMHCLHVIIVFNFVVAQFYDKEDDDTIFRVVIFFLLQHHLV